MVRCRSPIRHASLPCTRRMESYIMPATAWGIWYPDSTAHTRLWEHFQQLAESVNATVVPPIYASRYKSVDQPLPQSTYTTVGFDTDSGSSGIVWDNVENYFVVQTDGRYYVTASLNYD